MTVVALCLVGVVAVLAFVGLISPPAALALMLAACFVALIDANYR